MKKKINLYIEILNMSLTGAFVILMICLVRLILRKSPKIFLYCLWIVAGFRLAFPFSIESTLSLMPFNAQPIPTDMAIHSVTNVGGSQLQLWATISPYIWLVGVVFMLLRGVISFVVLKRKLKGAVNIEANIYEIRTLKTPLVIGFLSPKIYLPTHAVFTEFIPTYRWCCD